MQLNTLLAALLHLTAAIAQTQLCNNAAALCGRNYNNVTHLGAHDSPFVRNATNGYSVAGNQMYTTLQQLDSGVRLVSGQVHAVTGNGGPTQWRLCHTNCQLYDAGYLLDWLQGIKGWLDDHPNDIVTILLVNSDDADAATLGGIYQQAGMDQYSYQPTSTTQRQTQWPTLSDMISQNKRAVSFIANLDPATNTAAPYLLDEFTFVFENSYDNVQPSDFSCEPDRPASLSGNIQGAISGSYMPLMNHFRYDEVAGFQIPSVNTVNVTNAPSGGEGNLGDAAATCSQAYGRAPTFILVDFASVGPAITTVDRLNGVTGQTSGRLIVPDTIAGAMAEPSPTATSSASAGGSAASSSSSASSSNSLTFDGSSLFSNLRASVMGSMIGLIACLMILFA